MYPAQFFNLFPPFPRTTNVFLAMSFDRDLVDRRCSRLLEYRFGCGPAIRVPTTPRAAGRFRRVRIYDDEWKPREMASLHGCDRLGSCDWASTGSHVRGVRARHHIRATALEGFR